MPSIASVAYSDDKALIQTRPCHMCGKTHKILLDKDAFQAWYGGVHAQVAFPDMTPGQREILISGTCEPCWDRLFKE